MLARKQERNDHEHAIGNADEYGSPQMDAPQRAHQNAPMITMPPKP